MIHLPYKPSPPFPVHTDVRVRVKVEIVPWERGEDGAFREATARAYRLKTDHSWVKGFAQLLYVGMGDVASQTLTDTGGTSRTLTRPSSLSAGEAYMRGDAGAGAATSGIQVGTSATALTRDDTKLGALVAHGTGSGQVQYGAVTIEAPAAISGGYEIRCSRSFTNNSGGTITLQEVGLAVQHESTPWNFLILHDLLSGGYALADGAVVTIRYLIDWLMSGTTQPWCKQVAQGVYTALSGTNSTIKDTGGTDRTVTVPPGQYYLLSVAAADATLGIVVGTGATAVTRDDTTLETQIAEGSGAGQLNHQGSVVVAPAGIADGYRIVLSRQLDNNSVGSITIREVGLYVGFLTWKFLVAHQLPQAIAIAPGASRTVTWDLNFLV